MTGFQSPNYTQTPNDFFAMIPEMEEAELRVTLVMIRRTFGFHRDEFKMGIRKLAQAAGLSPQGARDGAVAAEKRGTFRRTNPDESTEAEWALVVSMDPLYSVEGGVQSLEGGLQSVEGIPPAGGGQVPSKESIKKPVQKKDLMEGILANDAAVKEREHCLHFFEEALGFGSLPWDSKPEWRKFAAWVVKMKDDLGIFKDYVTWRNGQGRYKGAMTNTAIRRDPQIFMDTGWPTFLAHSAMYPAGDQKKSAAQSKQEANRRALESAQ